jgi:hypothetical protein
VSYFECLLCVGFALSASLRLKSRQTQLTAEAQRRRAQRGELKLRHRWILQAVRRWIEFRDSAVQGIRNSGLALLARGFAFSKKLSIDRHLKGQGSGFK